MTVPLTPSTKKFRYNLGDIVYDKHSEEYAIIEQKRVEYGNQIYYRLDNGAIRHESHLYKSQN